MSFDEQHIRHIMLYEYQRGNSATLATKNINEVYENALDVRKCQRWFAKFRSGDFSLTNLPRGGPEPEVDNMALEALVESNPRQTLREMAAIMECSHESIRLHLQQIGSLKRGGLG